MLILQKIHTPSCFTQKMCSTPAKPTAGDMVRCLSFGEEMPNGQWLWPPRKSTTQLDSNVHDETRSRTIGASMPILSKLRMPPAKIVNGNLTQVETYIGFHQVRSMVHVQNPTNNLLGLGWT